jgi:hypothetical protein
MIMIMIIIGSCPPAADERITTTATTVQAKGQ